jgi:hypothetical protein
MEDSSLVTTNKSQELIEQPSALTVKKFPIPSYQDVLTKIQQQAINQDNLLQEVEEDFAAIEDIKNFTTILEKDKEKAKKIIDSLVSSAKEMTSAITTSLTSVPVHPYEKLIYEYLGPDYKSKQIQDYSIPDSFNPFTSTKELRIIAEANQQLQMTQMAILSAEATNPTFDGTFATENLNNAFAEPVNTSDSKQQFVINEVKLKEHLEFIEMVKSIPVDYILKNPLEVAKKMISEFVRIHMPTQHIQVGEDLGVPTFAIQDIVNNPIEITKQLFNNYQQLNGSDNSFDVLKFIESLSKAQNLNQIASR